MTATLTLCFNDIFNDYKAFKDFTDTLGVYDKANAAAELLNQNLFYWLCNRYNGCDLAYDSADLFLGEFAIAYTQYFRQALKKIEVVDEVYKLNAEDFEVLSEDVTNASNSPNEIKSKPFELLDFITTQNRSRAKSNKLAAYIMALRNMPDAQIDAIIDKFDYLWLDILSTEDLFLY